MASHKIEIEIHGRSITIESPGDVTSYNEDKELADLIYRALIGIGSVKPEIVFRDLEKLIKEDKNNDI